MSGDGSGGSPVNKVIRRLAETESTRKRKRILEEELAKLPPQERENVAGWVAAFRMTTPAKKSQWERVAVFVAAVCFLLLLIGVHLAVPNPTASQSRTFNTVLAVMAGAFGAFLPGALGVKINGPGFALRGTSALALFLVVYFWSPA